MAYTKTNWTNTTPINTSNLNKIENGIEEIDLSFENSKEVVLYDNENGGSTGTITLSETSENFKYIEVFYVQTSEQVNGSTKIYKPDGKVFNCHVVYTNGDTTSWIQSAIYNCSGNTITKTANATTRIEKSVGTNVYGENNIAITRVLGYR